MTINKLRARYQYNNLKTVAQIVYYTLIGIHAHPWPSETRRRRGKNYEDFAAHDVRFPRVFIVNGNQ